MAERTYISGGQRVYIWSDGTENLTPEPARGAPGFAPPPATPTPAPAANTGGWMGDVARAANETNPLMAGLEMFLPGNREGVGSIIGDDVGRSAAAQAPLDFGHATPDSIDQQWLSDLTSIFAGIGGGTLPTAPTLPDAPTYSADPGLQSRADSARDRQTRISGLFDQQYSDLKADDPQNRNRWSRFGEYLSSLAADGNLANAGVLMSDLMQDERDYGQMMNETRLDGQLRGEEFDLVADEADAGVLSGAHNASERTTEARYGRDTNQTQLMANYALAAYEAQQRQAGEAARLATTLADAQHEISGRARDEWRGAVGMFGNVPRYAGQAAEALVPESIGDPRTRSALADGLIQQQAATGLQVYIQAHSQDVRGLTQFLRQFDPSITEEIVRRSDPMAVFLRAVNGPNAQMAFRSNPQLATYAQYASAPE